MSAIEGKGGAMRFLLVGLFRKYLLFCLKDIYRLVSYLVYRGMETLVLQAIGEFKDVVMFGKGREDVRGRAYYCKR